VRGQHQVMDAGVRIAVRGQGPADALLAALEFVEQSLGEAGVVELRRIGVHEAPVDSARIVAHVAHEGRIDTEGRGLDVGHGTGSDWRLARKGHDDALAMRGISTIHAGHGTLSRTKTSVVPSPATVVGWRAPQAGMTQEAASSRSSRRRILPTFVLGSSSRNSTCLGCL